MGEDRSQNLSRIIAEELELGAAGASSSGLSKSHASPLPVVKFTTPEGLKAGETIGKYKIVQEIGRGGMGVVYLAIDNLGRQVVVKTVSAIGDQAMAVKRFKREALAASRVRHPNVVGDVNFDEIGETYLLVMEHVDGRTLSEEVKGKRALPPAKAVAVVVEVLKGLAAIHAAGIVHRDLKPGNVMLTHGDDRVKILDFGLGTSMSASNDVAFDETLTQHGIPVGTPSYMSPEQALADDKLDARSDVYAIGVILFQLLAGVVPFDGKGSMPILQKHLSAPVPKIVPSVGMLPAGLQEIVEKAMAKRPEDRYQDADAMRRALETISFSAKPPPRRFNVASMLGLGAIIVVAAVLAFVLKPGAQADRRPSAAAPVKRAPSAPTERVVVKSVTPTKSEVPPPPLPVPTVADGCALFEQGRTSEAIAALTQAAAPSSDARSLYCLCGAYARQSNYGEGMRKTCDAYLRHPAKDSGQAKLVRIWLARVPK